MTRIPDFSEDTDNAMLLYFNAEGQDAKALCDELEKTYYCFDKMSVVTKDGKKYVELVVPNGEL